MTGILRFLLNARSLFSKNKNVQDIRYFFRPKEDKQNILIAIINYSGHKETAKIGTAGRIQEIIS